MRIPTFIGITSLLICSWLGIAFFRDVPTGNYPVIEGSFATKTSKTGDNTLAATRDEAPLEP